MLNDRVSLFCECFGDTREVANALFSCSDILNISICKEDRLVAMASLVPILEIDSGALGYYIYGVCVTPDMRGKGLFKQIMHLSETEAKNKGAHFVCLIPADDKLGNTYRRMGYNISVCQKLERADAVGLRLLSDEFRFFAKSETNVEVRQKGLLKVLNDNKFNTHADKLCFLDDMGDV